MRWHDDCDDDDEACFEKGKRTVTARSNRPLERGKKQGSEPKFWYYWIRDHSWIRKYAI
jgi:hypothetical protein